MILALSLYYIALCLAIAAIPLFASLFTVLGHAVVWPMALSCLGSVIYCLRAIYLHRCIRKDWDAQMAAWYWLRPLVGLLTGAVVFILVNAGLVMLNAEIAQQGNPYGLYAIAVIAGYNIDRFWIFVENVMQKALGIEPSRRATAEEKP
jgi:hypothetical protein